MSSNTELEMSACKAYDYLGRAHVRHCCGRYIILTYTLSLDVISVDTFRFRVM
jgi:hypothetical protein